MNIYITWFHHNCTKRSSSTNKRQSSKCIQWQGLDFLCVKVLTSLRAPSYFTLPPSLYFWHLVISFLISWEQQHFQDTVKKQKLLLFLRVLCIFYFRGPTPSWRPFEPLTSSFVLFGRSGRVTHADNLKWHRKSRRFAICESPVDLFIPEISPSVFLTQVYLWLWLMKIAT